MSKGALGCAWCLQPIAGVAPPPGLRPSQPWPGSKVRLAPVVLDLLHRHHAYVEPFAGSLAVLLAKPPVAVELVNDLDGHIVRFYSTLRDPRAASQLHEALLLTPYAQAEHEAAVDDEGLDDVERVRRWFVRTAMTHIGSASNHTQGRWTSTVRGSARASGAAKFRRYVDRLPDVAARLRHTQIACEDGLTLLHRVLAKADALTAIYVDPPYLPAPGRARTVRYASDRRSSEWHGQLVDLLSEPHDAQIVVSCYKHPTYDRLAEHGWHRQVVDVVGSGQPGRVTRRQETLFSNRRPPDTPTQGAGRYCSEACRRAAARARKSAARPSMRCARCGTLFTATRSDAQWCSSACRQAGYRGRLRDSKRR